MKAAGVSIIRINSMLPVKENVAQLLKMLKNLNEVCEAGETNNLKAINNSALKAIKI